jgi:hypothetical protein
MAAKNAHPTMATVAISLSRRGSTRIVDADTVLHSLGNSLPALLNDTPSRTNVPLSRVYSPNFVEGEFSEVELPLYGVLRSWHRGSAGGIMLVVEGDIPLSL